MNTHDHTLWQHQMQRVLHERYCSAQINTLLLWFQSSSDDSELQLLGPAAQQAWQELLAALPPMPDSCLWTARAVLFAPLILRSNHPQDLPCSCVQEWSQRTYSSMVPSYGQQRTRALIHWFERITGEEERELMGHAAIDAFVAFLLHAPRPIPTYDTLTARAWLYATALGQDAS